MPGIEALKTGDERVWEDFFFHFDVLIRSVVAWPRWHFDAAVYDDVIQTIRISIVQSVDRLQSEQSLQSFVKKICFNRCVDALRRQLRDQGRLLPMCRPGSEGQWEDIEFAAGEEFDPTAALQQEERVAVVRLALRQMDEESRGWLNQFYVEGLSYKEMAERQGVSINTVGSRLSRCLVRLRMILKGSGLEV